MIIPITLAVLAALLWAKLRLRRTRGLRPSRADFLARAVSGFAQPFLIVALPVLAVSIYLQRGNTNSATVERLLQIEKSSLQLQRWLSPFDSPAVTIALLGLACALAVLLFGGNTRLPRAVARGRRLFSGLYALVSAATFFSFFSPGAGEPALVAQGRLNRVEELQRTYGNEVAAATAEQTVEEMWHAVLDSLSHDLQKDLRDWERVDADWDRLWTEYAQVARRRPNPRTPAPLLIRYRPYTGAWTHPQPTDPWTGPDAPRQPQPAPREPAPDASISRLEEAIRGVREHRAIIGERLEQRLRNFGLANAAELRSELVKSPFGFVKTALAGAAGDHPLVRILAEVAVDAGTERIDHAVEQAVRAATSEATAGEHTPATVVEGAAKEAVHAVDWPSPDETRTARQLPETLEREARLIQTARQRLWLWNAEERKFQLRTAAEHREATRRRVLAVCGEAIWCPELYRTRGDAVDPDSRLTPSPYDRLLLARMRRAERYTASLEGAAHESAGLNPGTYQQPYSSYTYRRPYYKPRPVRIRLRFR